jgi:hypothetical protein
MIYTDNICLRVKITHTRNSSKDTHHSSEHTQNCFEHTCDSSEHTLYSSEHTQDNSEHTYDSSEHTQNNSEVCILGVWSYLGAGLLQACGHGRNVGLFVSRV